MKYETARELFFQYFIMEKELNYLNNGIRQFERTMPYDNGPASEFAMDLMDAEIEKKNILKTKMEKQKQEIELLLRVFK